MKTIFKSLLYFSFAGLILTGCAKNDDFSVPSVECENKDIAANKEIGEIYALTDTQLKQYDEDHIISGTVISSDRGGNFYREIYFVSDDNKFSALFKADIKGSYARYEVGSQIFIKLKDVHVQQNNGVLAIGARDTDPSKNFISYLADPTYKKFIVKGCNRISPEEVTKKFATELTLKEAATDANIGKLVTLTDVQFTADVRGKLFWSKDRPAPGNATLNEIEGKDGNPASKVVFRVVEQSSDFAGKTIPNNSGKMTGVMTKFGTGASLVYQFVPRFWEDLDLKQDPFEGASGPVDPEIPEDITVEPGKFLAFPGANFENWNAFTGTLNQYGLQEYAKQAPNEGWKNSNGLKIEGTPKGNDYVFTVQNVKNVPQNATRISFLVKGTSAASLVPLVFKANGTDYIAYNVGDLTTSKVVKADTKPLGNNTSPDYKGNIDTKGEWVKVILDLTSAPAGSGYNVSGTGNLFALKVGKEKAYNLIIDEITFEDGTGGEAGETPTDPETPGEGGENPGSDLPEAKLLTEDFEAIVDKANNYASKELELASGTWKFTDGGIFGDPNDLKSSGLKSVRLRGNEDGEATLSTNFVITGLKKVSLQFGGANFSEGADNDKEVSIEVFYSVDNGQTWKTISKEIGTRGEMKLVEFAINAKTTDKVMIKIKNTSFTRGVKSNPQVRVSIDDIKFFK